MNSNKNNNKNQFAKITSPEMLHKFIREGKLTTKNELLLLNFVVATTYGGYRPIYYTNKQLSLILNISTVTISKALTALQEQTFITMCTVRKKYSNDKFYSQRTISLNKENYYGTEEVRQIALEQMNALIQKAKEEEQEDLKPKEEKLKHNPSTTAPIEEPLNNSTSAKNSKSYQGFEF